ncbi:MAG: hypothetical protein UX06_C0021G0013 [Candidatus Giovannonibacteria bacterium GW2011_GWA2_45_21]|uniref:Uncharacterized protein n=1 Tax=Candidatus Giovannonibacteria bacterium GW2011_GWA2_45_21 TaxID=1618649 RepID=A0A0G1Q6Y8_9BACT|nr:MAG: hypothetical protein UX06_C0021G0013 [Candidatus Giovannonibacteria bacterium GW2011_GWA2_45_21]
MHLFQKTVINNENRKKENADKKPLFAELKHPKTAERDQPH